MELREFIPQSEEIITRLREEINQSETSLKQAQEKILEHINRLGQIMVDEVIEGVKEPVMENQVVVNEKVAVFDGVRNLRFINRFGGVTVKSRRCYKYLEQKGGYYPLDEKLGIDDTTRKRKTALNPPALRIIPDRDNDIAVQIDLVSLSY